MSGAPPPIRTSDPGSFAERTLRERVPRILDDTIAAGAYPDVARPRLFDLRAELVAGRLRALVEDAPDRAEWDRACAPHVGRTWLDLPWFFAEAYFYRRVLEATGWFQPGRGHRLDPFLPLKREEERPAHAPRLLESVLAEAPADLLARARALLHASLWGNRVDLSSAVAKGMAGGARDERENLIVDDTDAVLAALQERSSLVVLFADNAGTELAMDLALADLLAGDLGARVRVLLKAQPTFVSDAMPEDVERLLDVLESSGPSARGLSERVRGHERAGRISLQAHPFLATSRFFDEMPADLEALCRQADLVVLKGDANYRRLLRDARWPTTTPFGQAVARVPGRLVALRTCKAELVVGLLPGQAEALDREEPGWLVGGRRAVIQARL